MPRRQCPGEARRRSDHRLQIKRAAGAVVPAVVEKVTGQIDSSAGDGVRGDVIRKVGEMAVEKAGEKAQSALQQRETVRRECHRWSWQAPTRSRRATP